MKISGKIITVGLSPSWDVICQFENIDWGQHKTVDSRLERPAGKAMNISRCLAWMGQKTIAAGLWGCDDYQQMLKAMRPLSKLINIKMTMADGMTRQNITIIDRAKNREMHIRNLSQLASKKTLKKLKADLGSMVNKNSICVFAGAMPDGELSDNTIKIIDFCHSSGAKIAVDTSGETLGRIVDCGKVWLIKPNVEELRELLAEPVADRTGSLVKAGCNLLGKVEVVLISRGKKGAIAVTRDGRWCGKSVGVEKKALSTVGCGDYFLAGFLKGFKDNCDMAFALKTAIQAAAARAWSQAEQKSWTSVKRRIKTEIYLL